VAKLTYPLKTADIAKAVGVHPNTVRLYETWGFLPPVPRAPNGYRLYAEFHLDQMRLARTALHGQWPGRNIRRSALELVRKSASSDVRGTLKHARQHLLLVQAERAQADEAVEALERWARGKQSKCVVKPLQIKETAALLDISTDVLRNWERNALIKTPRHPHSRYRLYGSAEIDRLRVLRLLFRAGYSAMAILRMMRQFNAGQRKNLRAVLDTPRPDEDVFSAADKWLSTLDAHEQRAQDLIDQLTAMLRKQRKQA
jgi:DNA-binding transcriptional MerR regulator